MILVSPADPEKCVNSLMVEKGVAWFLKPPDDPISDGKYIIIFMIALGISWVNSANSGFTNCAIVVNKNLKYLTYCVHAYSKGLLSNSKF